MSAPRIGAADIAAALAGGMSRLAPELLPAGRRDGGHWRCSGVDGSPGQSLAIHLHGARAGVWHDFSTGESGDALDLVSAARFGGNRRAAMDWACGWLGLTAGQRLPEAPRPAPAAVAAQDAADAERKRARALAVFLAGREDVRGTPAGDYLAGRGITFDGMARVPRALRFHAETWCGEAGKALPAMLAAITDGAGQHIATHRTYLARDATGTWRKAPLKDPKMTLGSYAGGFIPLWRGASGKPLRQAPDPETVAIAEGIETTLSVVLAVPHMRVLSAVALNNMARVTLPPAVRRVILCADNDDGNPQAAALLDRAAARFAAEGRDVRIARPPVGTDFNDTLLAESCE